LPSFRDCERKAIDLELAVWVKTRTSLPSLIAPVYCRGNKNEQKFKILLHQYNTGVTTDIF